MISKISGNAFKSDNSRHILNQNKLQKKLERIKKESEKVTAVRKKSVKNILKFISKQTSKKMKERKYEKKVVRRR